MKTSSISNKNHRELNWNYWTATVSAILGAPCALNWKVTDLVLQLGRNKRAMTCTVMAIYQLEVLN